MTKTVKIVVGVPTAAADKIRSAMAAAGAGTMGNYSHASFSSKGIGRFKPLEGADPAIGSVGSIEKVEEERVEMLCPKDKARAVVEAIKQAHPYEEPAIDVYPLEDI